MEAGDSDHLPPDYTLRPLRKHSSPAGRKGREKAPGTRLARRRFLRKTWGQGRAPGHQGLLGHTFCLRGSSQGLGSWARGSNVLKASKKRPQRKHSKVFSANEPRIQDNAGDTGPLNDPEVPLSSPFHADRPPPWGRAQTGRSWAPSTLDPRELLPLPWVLAPQGPPSQSWRGCGSAWGPLPSLGRPGGGAAHLRNLLRGVLIELKLDFCSD